MSKESVKKVSGAPEQGTNGPPPGFGKDVNDYLNYYVRNADAKAQIFIAADLTVGAFLLANQPDGFWAYVLNWLAIVLLVLSAFFGGLVVYPRIPSSSAGLIFWEDIRSRSGPQEYREALKGLDLKKVEEEYAAQNYYASQVLHWKYRWTGRCLLSFFAAVGCAVFSVGVL